MKQSHRMAAALVLSVIALSCLALVMPEYVANLREAMATRTPVTQEVSPLVALGSLAGLAAFVLVVVEQWRNREYGWIVASFVLSYLAVVTYAVRVLIQGRRSVHEAA